MAMLELPHTAGCHVCGQSNPHGLRLHLHVDPATGVVQTQFNPRSEHIGFQGIIHGGVLSAVFDEAMVWASTWAMRRFCVCAELTVRFKSSAGVGQPIEVAARVESARPRLVTASAEMTGADGKLIAAATGKFSPLPSAQHLAFAQTLIDDPATRPAAQLLKEQ